MKKTKMAVAGIAVLILALFWQFVLATSQDALDPLEVAPETHKLVFENALVRVIEARVPPGSLEPKHSHPRGLTVHLADYDVEYKTFPDGKVTKVHRSFGSVNWSEAVVHEVRNVSQTPSHAIRIELKR